MNNNNIKILYLLICLLILKIGKSCINEYRTLLDGSVVFTDNISFVPQGRFDVVRDKDYLIERLNDAKAKYETTKNLEDFSDLGAMYVYNGEYLKAKAIFQAIEKALPNLYQTAANLGTTYELLGQNDSALIWIKKAVEINPASHNHSEWIHVKILEAKIKANGNEQYLWNNNILNLNFGNNLKPKNINHYNLDSLEEQLYEQLTERMTFIKPKDPIIAQLLFELGNINAISYDVKSGLDVYLVAKEYGYTSDLIDKRIEYFEKLQSKAEFKNSKEKAKRKVSSNAHFILIGFTISVLLLIIFSIYIYKKNKNQSSLS